MHVWRRKERKKATTYPMQIPSAGPAVTLGCLHQISMSGQYNERLQVFLFLFFAGDAFRK